jgi:hypothetical protein
LLLLLLLLLVVVLLLLLLLTAPAIATVQAVIRPLGNARRGRTRAKHSACSTLMRLWASLASNNFAQIFPTSTTAMMMFQTQTQSQMA